MPIKAPMSEYTILKKVRRHVANRCEEGEKILVLKYHGDAYGSVGVSDLIMCINGLFVAIELKRKGRTPTLRQKFFIDKVIATGGKAAWFDNVDDACSFIDGVLGDDKD